ncbi:YhdP family protein [Uliginosibacterium sp. 31-16]|uniref:YhdP family protein n=1 Tax=Uliginosibacterium sp. 31-16 TaxID=3068315 RepID=UPI00273E3BE1|nr:YhdP family protein [Uliginosibacterium sp. 31-16]MDP5240403.1 YhdP family protein [Uliginosibacterium sp. 31-16]
MADNPADSRKLSDWRTRLAAACHWRSLGRACLRWPLHLPRLAWRGLWLGFFVLAIGFLLLRYVAAPQIAQQRDRIEQAISQQLGLKVEIAALDANWNGLRPELSIHSLRVFDHEDRVALELPRVEVSVAWSSLLYRRLRLYRLEVVSPELDLRREADGRIFIAGLHINSGGSDSGFGDFVLDQRQIVIREARLVWTDALREAPPLALDHVNLRLENSGNEHRFALLASPPAAYSANLDIRGDLRGEGFKRLEDWRGDLYLSLDEADLAVWQKWLDYPLALPRGRGGIRTWLSFDGKRLESLSADVALADVALRFGKDLPQLDLVSLQGRVMLNASADEVNFSAERLSLATHEGLRIGPTKIGFRYLAGDEKRPAQGSFSSGELDVRVLSQLAAYLPLPEDSARQLAEAGPSGRIVDMKLDWQGPAEKIARFEVKGRLDDLALKPMGHLPGFSGLSVQLNGNERSGEFRLNVKDGALHLPTALTESIELGRLDLAGGWSYEKPKGSAQEALTVKIGSGHAVNPYVSADVSGYWQARPTGPGYLDVRAQAKRAQLDAVWRYIPIVATEYVSTWLHESLTSGRGEDLHFQLTGDLTQFPFNKSPGVFRLESKLVDAKLETFAPGWPGVSAIQGSFVLDRQRMTIRAERGRYQGAAVRDVKVEIPDLMEHDNPVLTVDGKASGATTDFLHYVNASALAPMTGGFTRDLRASGNGNLDLHIEIPLKDPLHTRVKGDYRFAGNTLRLIPALPEFSEATGTLGFNEKGVFLPGADAIFLGKRVRATGVTEADGSLRFDGQGQITVAGLRRLVPNPTWDHLRGETAATALIRVRHNLVDVTVDSTLAGVSSELPPPMVKDAPERWPLRFNVRAEGRDGSKESTNTWRVKLDQRVDVAWGEQCHEQCVLTRGAVAVGEDAVLPAQGWRFSAILPALDASRWEPVVEDMLSGFGESATPGTLAIAARIGDLVAAGHRFRDVSGKALRRDGNWTLRLDGPDLAGDLSWSEKGNGSLRARLSQLSLQPVSGGFEPESVIVTGSGRPSRQPPALDVVAEHFRLGSMDLGKLSLQAVSDDKNWQLRNISLSAPDMNITGSGSWQRSAGTRIEFKLHSEDAGSMLGHFGQPNVLRRGSVDFEGNLMWAGLPTTLHYPSMNGSMKLKASDGQFRKMEPGAGRLIGILSLQSLPRRITLDFRDVFSEGFAFDNISGDMKVNAGVLHTGDLEVRGPAAKVFITGSTDLARETHDLHLRVQPTLSETVAVGVIVGQAAVGILNPAVGAAVYLGQKLLRDPVEKIFSYDYAVTGSWADPKVEKLEGRFDLRIDRPGDSMPTADESKPK